MTQVVKNELGRGLRKVKKAKLTEKAEAEDTVGASPTVKTVFIRNLYA